MGDILIVDDERDIRELISDILQDEGYTTRVAGTSDEAMTEINREPPDLVILDMIMDPGIDGLETYRRILKYHPGQKAILASGYSEPEALAEISRMGVVEYLKKPYTINQIGLKVREILKRG